MSSSKPTPPPPPPTDLPPSPALPPGSLILITGANGLLASHLCSALLSAGYRVRGTVRSARQHAWLADLFATRHGSPDRFELFEVPDMAAPRAFAQAVRGCAGVVHVAAPMLTETDAGKIVEGAVAGVREVLGAVEAEGSAGVRRVVVTSSAVAVRGMGEFVVGGGGGGGGKEGVKVRADEWNEDAVRAVAEGGGLEGMGVEERVMLAYAAGKTLAEKAVWEWEERVGRGRGVVVNTVVPSGVFGRPLSHEHQGYPSSSQWAPKAFRGDPDFNKFPSFYWISIKDMTRLHVAALLHPGVQSERIFGFAGTYTVNDFLALYRKHYPDRQFPEDVPGVASNFVEVEPAKRAEELLKDMGRPGFEALGDTVLDNIIDIA
ncbi:hypothetical protein BFW01_g11814 [Lasiodiplodia theobromae]|nr:hypothetical protein BFW01_g11814 [Lasiodiplodia theobromae]